MKILTTRERNVWISANVPILLRNKFDDYLWQIKDERDSHNPKVLERILERMKKDEMYSDELHKQLMRDHEHRSQ